MSKSNDSDDERQEDETMKEPESNDEQEANTTENETTKKKERKKRIREAQLLDKTLILPQKREARSVTRLQSAMLYFATNHKDPNHPIHHHRQKHKKRKSRQLNTAQHSEEEDTEHKHKHKHSHTHKHRFKKSDSESAKKKHRKHCHVRSKTSVSSDSKEAESNATSEASDVHSAIEEMHHSDDVLNSDSDPNEKNKDDENDATTDSQKSISKQHAIKEETRKIGRKVEGSLKRDKIDSEDETVKLEPAHQSSDDVVDLEPSRKRRKSMSDISPSTPTTLISLNRIAIVTKVLQEIPVQQTTSTIATPIEPTIQLPNPILPSLTQNAPKLQHSTLSVDTQALGSQPIFPKQPAAPVQIQHQIPLITTPSVSTPSHLAQKTQLLLTKAPPSKNLAPPPQPCSASVSAPVSAPPRSALPARSAPVSTLVSTLPRSAPVSALPRSAPVSTPVSPLVPALGSSPVSTPASPLVSAPIRAVSAPPRAVSAPPAKATIHAKLQVSPTLLLPPPETEIPPMLRSFIELSRNQGKELGALKKQLCALEELTHTQEMDILRYRNTIMLQQEAIDTQQRRIKLLLGSRRVLPDTTQCYPSYSVTVRKRRKIHTSDTETDDAPC